ncbi:MAG: DUF421 domain-containing protein [Oscillospiraceae bacterium]|nr:DUF421 domain-containing protein [Oscillospiraceae bacterium]
MILLQECGRTALTALASLAALFLLTKLMGARQVSQLSMFDYINGITIGSVTAELALGGWDGFPAALTAMIVYAGASVLIAFATNKSVRLRGFFVGRPMILYENGTLYEKNLARAKLDVNEFLTHCRCEGYFSLGDIETAVLETNGKISFLPKSAARPVTPEDLGLEPERASLSANVALDGEAMEKVLRQTGKDGAWLRKQLDAQGVKLADVLLACCDGAGSFSVYEKTGEPVDRDLFL